LGNKKLYSGIYNLNIKENRDDGKQSVIDKIIENKSYLNTQVREYEIYGIESYQMKRARKEKEALLAIKPKEPETTLMKQLLHEALSDKTALVRMSPEKLS